MTNLFARSFVLLTSCHCVAVTACRANCALYVGLVSIGTLGDTFCIGLTQSINGHESYVQSAVGPTGSNSHTMATGKQNKTSSK